MSDAYHVLKMASERSRLWTLIIVFCAALLDDGFAMSPPVPQLARTVQCLALNKTAMLMEPGYNCTQLLDEFADVYTTFLECSIENAHPTCMCEACVPYYREMKRMYKKIGSFDTEQKSQNNATGGYVAGHRCTESLLRGSKLGVLQSVVGFAEKLWQDASCGCCTSNKTTVNSTTVLTPEALKFYWHLENLTKCMAEYTVIAEDLRNAPPIMESPVASPVPDAFFSNTDNVSVCTACKSQYDQLVRYYSEYQANVTAGGCSVCADIQDHINKTRLQWSQIYNCGRSTVDLATVLSLGLAMLMLPVVFYLGACLCGTYTERKMNKEQGQMPRTSSSFDVQTDGKERSQSVANYGSLGMSYRSTTPITGSIRDRSLGEPVN